MPLAPARDLPLGDFPPELESLFQTTYYANIRGMLRVSAGLVAALFLAYTLRDYLDTHSLWLASRANAAPALGCLVLVGCTYTRWFGRWWQPVLVLGAWVVAALALSGTAAYFSLHPPPGSHEDLRPMPPELLFYALEACLFMVCCAVFRLLFKWSLALQVGVLLIGGAVDWHWLLRGTRSGVIELLRYAQPTLLVVTALGLMAYVQDRLARRAFYANYLLNQARDHERRRRENAEATLQVLNRAIGGVVHDLGNPLASVMAGSKTLLLALESDAADPRMIKELAEAVREGGQMLDYLRLSLIEETRVLAGQPVPLERAEAPLRRIVEAGVRYQKPRYAHRRVTSIVGEDLALYVDELKLVTVFMNLVGNALKYSDGEVRVTWRADDDRLLVAVMDEGTAGRGLTPAQAAQLFVPFGRLPEHAAEEGLGLGLLSVRKTVAAHGGDVWLEGLTDAWFSTAAEATEPLLIPPFRTAFVVALPLDRPD